ncbi:MAG: hypothetical protein ACYC8T_26265 [Myxococcaceae bacterium]
MEELFDILKSEAKRFGPTLALTAYQRGLAVTAKDGSTRPIPITATPVVVGAAELERRVGLSARLSSAGLKMSRAMLSGEARELLLSALSPLERTLAEKTWQDARLLATTRVDFFVDGRSRPFALEINATIPAMQGYSDIAAQAFLEVVGRHFGLPNAAIARLQARNRPNALPLYRALLDGYAKQRGGAPSRIALLCRRNDAQLTEQRYLCERFRELGAEADVVHPDQLSGSDALYAEGKKYDLVYRHLFVRRLEEPDLPGAAFVRELLTRQPDPRAVVLNPPASQIEVKTTFALLSQAAAEPALASAAGLSDEELEAIATSVPWTRPFRRAPATGPDGAQVQDLVERVAAEPSRFVLKRAWDYGGRAVFVGRSEREASFDERVRAAYGRSLSWAELAGRCADDRVGGGFVVQELVETKPVRHLLCSGDTQTSADLYVDFSAYASVGLDRQPAWGGVCRGSPSHIVNIVGGGGVLPLITEEVALALLAAHRAR